MNKTTTLILTVILSISLLPVLSFADVDLPEWSVAVRVGGHYTTLDDYYQKAGEYYLGEDGTLPEFGLDLSSYLDGKSFAFTGDYFDKKNMFGNLDFAATNILRGSVSYRSFYRNFGTDLLENMMARESVNPDENTPGGKIITHEDLSPGEAYGYTQHEVKSNLEFSVPVNENQKLKFIASHRTVLQKGSEQELATMHCSSCHISSQKAEVDRASHNLSFDAQTSFSELELGYGIDYNYFDSKAAQPEVLYDLAQHPGHGGAVAEFNSRLNYSNEETKFNRQPKTEKLAHRVNLKIPAGNGYFAGAFIKSTVTNKWNDLKTTSNGGLLKYNSRLTSKINLMVNARLNRINSDNVFIDLDPWREGRSGGGQDLDYTSYSMLTRTVYGGDADMRFKPNRKSQVNVKVGYERTQRDDYPIYGDKDETTKMYGELKAKHRLTKTSTLRFKYRLASIDNPFTIFNQLLEAEGNGTIEPLPGNGFAYYFQRDELRYGNSTNQPSMKHHVDFSVNIRAMRKLTFSGGVKYTMEKNSDLDTFEYEKTTLAPNANINFAAGSKWNFFAGGSMLKQTANAPVAFAMFDG